MKTLAIVFAYERPSVLSRCLDSLSRRGFVLHVIDDSRTDAVSSVVAGHQYRDGDIEYYRKPHSGFSDSACLALRTARAFNPDYLYLIESDYRFAPDAFSRIQDVFEKTEHGRKCLGIVGYDHPNFYRPEYTEQIFPDCMKQQMGEDNVNRAVLYQPFRVGVRLPYFHILERVSNTCFTCYLNWKKIQEVAAEFPELNDYLDQACAPRDNPNYPTSGEYKRKKVVDDGMLSHGINLVWNKWAIKRGIDRNEYSAWLNIKPSIAQNINGGGMHTELPEGETDNGSPSWRD
jgi:hypothetical protein